MGWEGGARAGGSETEGERGEGEEGGSGMEGGRERAGGGSDLGERAGGRKGERWREGGRERDLEGQRDSDGRDGKRALDNTSLGGRGGGERHLQPQGAIAAGRGGGERDTAEGGSAGGAAPVAAGREPAPASRPRRPLLPSPRRRRRRAAPAGAGRHRGGARRRRAGWEVNTRKPHSLVSGFRKPYIREFRIHGTSRHRTYSEKQSVLTGIP